MVILVCKYGLRSLSVENPVVMNANVFHTKFDTTYINEVICN